MKLRVCRRGGERDTKIRDRVGRASGEGAVAVCFFLQSLWVHGNGSPHTCKARCGGLVFGRRGGEEGRKGGRDGDEKRGNLRRSRVFLASCSREEGSR